MPLDQLIERLQELRARHGNIPVRMMGDSFDEVDVNSAQPLDANGEIWLHPHSGATRVLICE